MRFSKRQMARTRYDSRFLKEEGLQLQAFKPLGLCQTEFLFLLFLFL